MYSLVGPPGVGKSTQAAILKAAGCTVFSAGELLREFAPAEILQQMNQGQLAEHDYTNSLVAQRLDKLLSSPRHLRIIIDGYPRAVVQARWLLETYKAPLQACLWLRLDSLDEVVARLLSRGRSDDTPQSIKQRLQIYNQNINLVLAYYQAVSLPVITIDATQSADCVSQVIKKVLNIVQPA